MLITYLDDFGSSVYLGLSGDNKQEIEQEFWGYCNLGFADTLTWGQEENKPYFAYFAGATIYLFPVLRAREEFRLLQKLDTLNKRSLGDSESNEEIKELSRLGAAEKLSRFVPLQFVNRLKENGDFLNCHYSLELVETVLN